jgi:hypothetical protein
MPIPRGWTKTLHFQLFSCAFLRIADKTLVKSLLIGWAISQGKGTRKGTQKAPIAKKKSQDFSLSADLG